MRGVSNLWGQSRPEGDPEPAPEVQAGVDNEAEIEIGPEVEAEMEAVIEAVIEERIDVTIEPVVTRDGLPTMAQLDALSSELDEIDAALAAMDADPSLPGRATTQNA